MKWTSEVLVVKEADRNNGGVAYFLLVPRIAARPSWQAFAGILQGLNFSAARCERLIALCGQKGCFAAADGF